MRFLWLVSLALLSACSNSVLVPVPPRIELKSYGILGIVEFSSEAGAAINAHATRQFQEHVQSAQPGTRFIELGNRQAVLAAVGARQLDADAFRKIGAKYGVAAVFLGELVYSEPKADIRLNDLTKLDGAVRSEIRGDISSRLVEAGTGAAVWSNSAWVKKPLGRLSVSAEHGVSAAISKSDPRSEMVPALVYHLTHDFRPSSVRQAAK
jgi:hypothetical protein